MLLWGWLGVGDTKSENFKIILKTLEDQTKVPLYRLQDTGIALGGEFSLRKPNKLLAIGSYYKVNAFPEFFIKSQKGNFKVHWIDFYIRKELFSKTTWEDLKWMAMIILNLPCSYIYSALEKSGMPEEVVEIYYYKLLKRRNDMILAFELENEFSPEEVPDLKVERRDESGDFTIKKGKG